MKLEMSQANCLVAFFLIGMVVCVCFKISKDTFSVTMDSYQQTTHKVYGRRLNVVCLCIYIYMNQWCPAMLVPINQAAHELGE